jgi:hypothetical protein
MKTVMLFLLFALSAPAQTNDWKAKVQTSRLRKATQEAEARARAEKEASAAAKAAKTAEEIAAKHSAPAFDYAVSRLQSKGLRNVSINRRPEALVLQWTLKDPKFSREEYFESTRLGGPQPNYHGIQREYLEAERAGRLSKLLGLKRTVTLTFKVGPADQQIHAHIVARTPNADPEEISESEPLTDYRLAIDRALDTFGSALYQ